MLPGTVEAIAPNEILFILPPTIKGFFQKFDKNAFFRIEEIRMRTDQPLIIRDSEREYSVDSKGAITSSLHKAYKVTREDIIRTIAAVSDNSLYAFEEEIRKGFITIAGGHRVGLAGQVVLHNDMQIKSIKEFSSICIRIAREIKDCSKSIINKLYGPGDRVLNTLLVSPPRCGKTTLLRDIARQLSMGNDKHQGKNVVIIDERSELAGSYLGIPQLDVGPRTDVLDGCPKALGMIMAIRSMSPDVLITDELGRQEDVEAVREAVNAGVSIISSIHAGSRQELYNRPIMKELINSQAFTNIIMLSRRKGPGSIEEIIRWD
jgi:stage III sporulation protein AA